MYQKRAKIGVCWPKTYVYLAEFFLLRNWGYPPLKGKSFCPKKCMLQLWLILCALQLGLQKHYWLSDKARQWSDRCICIYSFCLKWKSFRDESGWYIWDLLVGGSSLISSESSPPCQSTHHTIDSFSSPQKFYKIPFNKVIQLTFQHCLKFRIEHYIFQQWYPT